MENRQINVLIADDEKIVREGLHHIIDWEDLGFCICAEAATGTEALEKMKQYEPDIVLLDIRMPGMFGTDLMEIVRRDGYCGYFIILSGYSDFKYAQSALHSGASFYLTKPIDEDELTEAVLQVKDKIIESSHQKYSMHQYRQKARVMILQDLLTKAEHNPSLNYVELGLSAPVYQVVIYESYLPYINPYNFAYMLRVTNQDQRSFEHITINGQEVILLKGPFALERFNSCLRHYEIGTQKSSPLDTIFLTYGPVVSSITRIWESYEACTRLMQRRFFCDENQHVLSYEMLPQVDANLSITENGLAQSYGQTLVQYIMACNRRRIGETLAELKKQLLTCRNNITEIKYFLADIFFQIKQHITHTYANMEVPFLPNSAILEEIEKKSYLYEILLYFTEQFDMIIRAIGATSRESVFDDILHYIDHAFTEPLKLETIAPLFGYNSSYLGKLFSQKMGMTFNNYLDKLRIRYAIELLTTTDMKVYEIASRAGYKNVDYFHQKFKKSMNQSPAEYRRNECVTSETPG